MSYDLMVFHPLKVSHGLGEVRTWFHAHMEDDVLLDKPPDIFRTFLQSVENIFPPLNRCPEERLDYACEYGIHEDFIYMCFGYSVAKEAHEIVKRQAGIDNLGFWDVSQSFDKTFPVTFPGDLWPMLAEAEWIKYGRHFVYDYESVRKIIVQMKTEGRSSFCLTDRYGNYIQAGGYGDAFIVELRRYVDAVTYEQLRADLEEESSEEEASASINGWELKAPRSQILPKAKVFRLFQDFTEEMKLEEGEVFWKRIEV